MKRMINTFKKIGAQNCGVLIVLVMVCHIGLALAQQETSISALIRRAELLAVPMPVRALADSATGLYNAHQFKESVEALKTLMAKLEGYEHKRLLRAWSYEWLAFNYKALGNMDTVENYVRLSLREHKKIFPEYADSRMPEDVRTTYERILWEIHQALLKRQASWGASVGTLTKLEMGYRYRSNDFFLGIGSPVVQVVQEGENPLASFNSGLLFLRMERVRRKIDKSAAGFFLDFALLARKDEPLAKIIGAGPLLSFFINRSGLEAGGRTEILRIEYSKGIKESKTRLGQSFSSGNAVITYANIEIYLRKWF
jgi:hypothetical protein